MARQTKRLVVKVSLRAGVAFVLRPLWLAQVKLGRNPWMPRWAFRIEGPL